MSSQDMSSQDISSQAGQVRTCSFRTSQARKVGWDIKLITGPLCTCIRSPLGPKGKLWFWTRIWPYSVLLVLHYICFSLPLFDFDLLCLTLTDFSNYVWFSLSLFTSIWLIMNLLKYVYLSLTLFNWLSYAQREMSESVSRHFHEGNNRLWLAKQSIQ